MSLSVNRTTDVRTGADVRVTPPVVRPAVAPEPQTIQDTSVVGTLPPATPAQDAAVTTQTPAPRQEAPQPRESPPVILSLDEGLQDNSSISESTRSLTPQDVRRLAQQTSLRPQALATLQGLKLSQTIVATSVTNRPIPDEKLDRLTERFGTMNRYGDEQEGGHIEDTAGPERDMNRMGLLTVYIGGENQGRREDLAYAAMYPARVDQQVASRTGPYSNGCIEPSTSEYFAEAQSRANWGGVADSLSQKVPGSRVKVDDIMHLYDYAVGPNAESLESNGLARIALKTLQGHLQPNQFLVGFIDTTPPESSDDLDHRKSTLASMATGCFLAGTVPTSHDGDHPSILVAASPAVEPAFSPADQVIAERGAQLDLGPFISTCEHLLDANPDKVIALDPERQAYVLTTLMPRQEAFIAQS